MAPLQWDMLKPQLSKSSINNRFGHEYPEGKEFAVCLIHDIDLVFPSLSSIFHLSHRQMKKGSIKDGFKALFSRFGRKFNPFFNFEEIIELERKYDATSGFYFAVLQKGRKGYNYNISDLACELKDIRENGWEVGFLGSQSLCCDAEDMLSQKLQLEDVLRDKVLGYVSPQNSFTTPETWKMLDLAGFEYITTYVDTKATDLSTNLYYPLRAHDHEKKDIDIIVLPLNVMNYNISGSFVSPNGMSNDIEEVWQSTKELIDQVSERSGVLTLRWPNTAIMGDGLDLYEKILSYCSEKNAWMTSGKEIIKWWSQSILKG
jgi:hypothetical protein